ncbi:MAG TPA: hypothetical protein DD670_10745 [Planctomycetaceae bacterium]|nr:hypothetical protein [Planctomycetaceae bacterium]
MARLVCANLKARRYDVFMDVEDLRSGQFNESLLHEIDAATDVIVILTPGSLDRCFRKGDWLRWEVAHAIASGKNVVPVITRGFAWPAQPLPEGLKRLPYYQGVEPSHSLFNASIDKLVLLLQGRPRPRTWRWIAGLGGVAIGLVCISTVPHLIDRTAPGRSQEVPVQATVSSEVTPISLVEVPVLKTRLALPLAEEATKAAEAVRQECVVAQAQTHSDSVPDWKALVQKSEETKEPAHRLAYLELARDSAALQGRCSNAIELCDSMQEMFAFTPFQINSMKAETLLLVQRAAINPKSRFELGATSIELARHAIAMDDYTSAEQLVTIAASAGRTPVEGLLGADFLANQVSFVRDDIARGKEYYSHVWKLAERLRDEPSDPRSNVECGKYLCFAKNAWAVGLPMIAKGDNPGLRALAEKEMQPPLETTGRLALGDAWWALAENVGPSERANYQQRAKCWYLRAIGREADISKRGKLRVKLQERLAQIPAQPAQLRLQVEVEGGTTLIVASDGIYLWHTYGVRNVKVNFHSCGTYMQGRRKTKRPKIIRNYGATRFLPEGVDFARARLEWKKASHPWGKVTTFDAMEDCLQIRLSDSPGGASAFTLVIVFPP